jgi:alpha-N-arabinofuranosidase
VLRRPELQPSPADDWSRWIDRFHVLSAEWLRMRSPVVEPWFAVDPQRGELALVARADSAGGRGHPSFLGRRLRHPAAKWTAQLLFSPEHDGDFAGLLALIDESHFLAFGIEQVHSRRMIALRTRSASEQAEQGRLVGSWPMPAEIEGDVELRLAIDRGLAEVAWRPVGKGDFQVAAKDIDIEYMSSIHAGLFTGVLVGPYAFSPAR